MTSANRVVHTHGWAKVNGVWLCVQDYYAEGHAPDTGCGAVMS